MKSKDEVAGRVLDIMDVHDLARYLRLSEAKIYKLARAGGIPAFRLGKTWRFRKTLIDEWIQEQTMGSLKMGGERLRPASA